MAKSNCETVSNRISVFVKELWQAAVNMSGLIEPADYKRYVLPFVFLRFLSIRFGKRRRELKKLVSEPDSPYYDGDAIQAKEILDDPDEYYSLGAFMVPEPATWQYIMDHAQDDDINLSETVHYVVVMIKNNLKVDWTKPHRAHRIQTKSAIRAAVKQVLRRKRLDEDDFEEIRQFLVSNEQIEVPDVVYHYCPMSAFMGIMESGELWLSHHASMNDLTETRWFYRLLLEEASKLVTHANQGLLESFLHNFELNLKDYFLVSFSKAPDVLSQWVMYADHGRGVAIGFHIDSLRAERGIPRYGIGANSVGVFPVEYTESTVRQRAQDMIETVVKGVWGDLPPSVEPLVLSVKHTGFSNEQEVRLVEVQDLRLPFNPDVSGLRTRHPGKAYRYRTRSDGELVMYRGRPFRTETEDHHLHSIWFGPQNESDMNAVGAFLDSRQIIVDHGFQHSEIPYFQAR